jgi:hypothetical protein
LIRLFAILKGIVVIAQGLFRLQVFMLPLQAGGARPGDEPNPAFAVDHLPFLVGVVEFDLAGPGDFQSAHFVKWNSLGPKTMGCAVGVELDVDFHGG